LILALLIQHSEPEVGFIALSHLVLRFRENAKVGEDVLSVRTVGKDVLYFSLSLSLHIYVCDNICMDVCTHTSRKSHSFCKTQNTLWNKV
jgi:hypothetical protein